MSNFYNIYVSLCAKHKKSKSKVAEEIGLSRASAYGWTNGALPSDVNLQKIADYFGVTVEYLKGEEETKKSPEELKLTEGEEMLLSLFRQIPEERQQAFLEMGRLYSDSLKKD